ncbi:MAG: hypothetical protein AB1801_27790 [Chloroflexota bacterium]
MLTFLTKDANIEAIKADLLAALSRRNFEAAGLQSRLPWKMYHIEMALDELLRAGRVVSFWTDSGRSQRQFYALTENFDPVQPVMQICASAEALEKLGPINLTSRQEIQQAQTRREADSATKR